ncbi:MAG: hypothetical protein B5M48_04210 [Candidatus Omnitrophica bacterium 4484_213]|nr:MAG: hypothetical protein B5M48_04210 [Candidatus Omnitrophica bacterium 4484_213]
MNFTPLEKTNSEINAIKTDTAEESSLRGVAERVKDVSSSATLAITSRAKEIKKKGKKIINFAAGEPDFDTPDFIKQEAIKALKQGWTKYTPVSGVDELKDAIIYVRLCSAIPVIVPTEPDNDFKLSPTLLKTFLSPKTKAIILNSPANPTGAVYSPSELAQIGEIAVRNNIYIVSDEIYERLIYEKEHISIASLDLDIYKLTVVINGVSKSYAMTGWRIGYAAGRQEIISKMAIIQSHSTSCANSIAQYAAVAALKNQDYPQRILSEFKIRRDYIMKKLDEIKISYVKPDGTFYIFCEIGGEILRRFAPQDEKSGNFPTSRSEAFALALLEKEGVAQTITNHQIPITKQKLLSRFGYWLLEFVCILYLSYW